jgi:hypothetical protein
MTSQRRSAIQYMLAALVAFAGSFALLTVGKAFSGGAPPGTGLLTYAVASLLILTGAVMFVMATAELVHARGSLDGSTKPRQR